jgi:hypothetical protein
MITNLATIVVFVFKGRLQAISLDEIKNCSKISSKGKTCITGTVRSLPGINLYKGFHASIQPSHSCSLCIVQPHMMGVYPDDQGTLYKEDMASLDSLRWLNSIWNPPLLGEDIEIDVGARIFRLCSLMLDGLRLLRSSSWIPFFLYPATSSQCGSCSTSTVTCVRGVRKIFRAGSTYLRQTLQCHPRRAHAARACTKDCTWRLHTFCTLNRNHKSSSLSERPMTYSGSPSIPTKVAAWCFFSFLSYLVLPQVKTRKQSRW